MSVFQSSLKFWKFGIILLFNSILLLSCRKEIEYKNNYIESQEPVNSADPILYEWEEVELGVSVESISKIESNGEYIVFLAKTSFGVYQFYKLDSLGNVNSILSPLNGAEPSILTYQSPYFFTSRPNQITNSVFGFDESGIQFSLDFDLSSTGVVRSLIKEGNTIYIGGSFSESASALPNQDKICLVDATTGQPLAPLEALNTNATIRSLAIENGQFYVGGYNLASVVNNSLISWNGVTWTGFGGNLISDGSGNSPTVRSIVPIGQNKMLISRTRALNEKSIGILDFDIDYFSQFELFGDLNNSSSNDVGRLKSCPGGIFAVGEYIFPNGLKSSILIYLNGVWKRVGVINMVVNDVTTLNGYVYATVEDRLYRYKIAI